jgi:hypothetical protein
LYRTFMRTSINLTVRPSRTIRWVQSAATLVPQTYKKSSRQSADYFAPLAQNHLMVFFPALNLEGARE